MKANEFVKKAGWDEAKRVIKLTIGEFWADHYDIKEDSIGTAGTIYSKRLCEHNDNFVCLRDLKRLVESHEFVSANGGVDGAMKYINSQDPNRTSRHYNSLRAKVADVESCL